MPNIAYSLYHAIKSIVDRLISPVKTSADTALSTANTALSTAETALTTSETALTTAETANTTADTALTTAETALTTANTANTTANTALTTANNAISGIPVTDLSTTLVNSTINGTAREIGRVKLTINSTTTAILASANIVFVSPSNTAINIKAYLDINSGLQPEQNITTFPATGHFMNATLSHRVVGNATTGEKNIRVMAYVPNGTTITISSISVWAIGHLVNA